MDVAGIFDSYGVFLLFTALHSPCLSTSTMRRHINRSSSHGTQNRLLKQSSHSEMAETAVLLTYILEMYGSDSGRDIDFESR
jgi:hypothetical protein